MAEATKQCATRLLADAPTTKDAFGHARVAEAIADLIFHFLIATKQQLCKMTFTLQLIPASISAYRAVARGRRRTRWRVS
jgi:hypothetical protein